MLIWVWPANLWGSYTQLNQSMLLLVKFDEVKVNTLIGSSAPLAQKIPPRLGEPDQQLRLYVWLCLGTSFVLSSIN